MHYRVCWPSSCESQCHDGDGASPCTVIDPVGTRFDAIIGQWSDNKISQGDAERARLAYGTGKTVYIRARAKSPGAGTLAEPYATLSEARHVTSNGIRFILLSEDGTFSVEP
jgi:hypothetical protein